MDRGNLLYKKTEAHSKFFVHIKQQPDIIFTERWLSGRRRRSRKPLNGLPFRRFESCPLRHLVNIPRRREICVFSEYLRLKNADYRIEAFLEGFFCIFRIFFANFAGEEFFSGVGIVPVKININEIQNKLCVKRFSLFLV